MATSGDVTVAQDSQGNVKLHPYLVTLVRWCVSCLWSTASVLVQRLMTAPLQPITGPKPPGPKSKPPKRAASTDHLHPEPRVECQLLHQPDTHTLDVIFVHGLYGSLGNTWRQGEWRQKYKTDPKKIILRDHSTKTCECKNTYKSYTQTNSHIYNGNNEDNNNKCDSDDITDLNEEMTFKNVNEKLFKKIIPKENDLITEQFYNNTLLDQVEIVDNYETQAKFVRDLFKRENENCDNGCDDNRDKCNFNENKCNSNENKCNSSEINEVNECKCSDKKCEVGCGCICDDCYSSCWPRDWIKEDFPGARVISVNYTSDPYLWRPLWIKENKRLSLHVRASQMMRQLLAMGVGERPVVWVGHSKGGLFIKQIFCEAYEAYQKLHKETVELPRNTNEYEKSNSTNDPVIAETIDNIVGSMFDNKMYADHMNYNDYIANNRTHNDYIANNMDHKEYEANGTSYNDHTANNMRNNDHEANIIKSKNDFITNVMNEIKIYENKRTNYYDNSGMAMTNEQTNIMISNDNENKCKMNSNGNEVLSLTIEECSLQRLASLYSVSAGFMFYSVPHRGSPLADIKTPVTARSLELLEICKDCPLVRALQTRWHTACEARGRRPTVRGFVETGRTLMSVLWLRIVSVDSADAGIGTLLGVSVDHREICKPSSRHCLLYTELTDLINEALNKNKCNC